jgi:ribonuclease T1
MQTFARILGAFLACALLLSSSADTRGEATAKLATREITVTELPVQARETIALIRKGGPYPYPRDGIVFGNFEKQLPVMARGYYREYTVKTPGARDRGARRIVAGKGGELYYTDNHYRSFKRIRE